jgi:hypothetical protein
MRVQLRADDLVCAVNDHHSLIVILLALRFRGAEIPFLTFYCIVCLVLSSVGTLTRRFLCENVDRYVTLCCRPPILCPSSNVRLKLLQTSINQSMLHL